MSKQVGIRELKAHLSRYVKEVKQGEEILVSERGKVVARLVPSDPVSEADRTQQHLLKLAAEGAILLPRTRRPTTVPASRIKVEGTPFSDAVIEDRR